MKERSIVIATEQTKQANDNPEPTTTNLVSTPKPRFGIPFEDWEPEPTKEQLEKVHVCEGPGD